MTEFCEKRENYRSSQLSQELFRNMRGQKLCHNCDTRPVFAVKINFIDMMSLLILRNLLKTGMRSKIPAYRLIRHLLFFFELSSAVLPLPIRSFRRCCVLQCCFGHQRRCHFRAPALAVLILKDRAGLRCPAVVNSNPKIGCDSGESHGEGAPR